jgi:hypothetical protein
MVLQKFDMKLIVLSSLLIAQTFNISIMVETFGKLKSFGEEKNSWKHYCESQCRYFAANDIENKETAN